jgi:hypothetical protein
MEAIDDENSERDEGESAGFGAHAATVGRLAGQPQELKVVNPRAAGIHIGSQIHVVAVSSDCEAESVRTFRSFTPDLHRLAEWLEKVGVANIATAPPSSIRASHRTTHQGRLRRIYLPNAAQRLFPQLSRHYVS